MSDEFDKLNLKFDESASLKNEFVELDKLRMSLVSWAVSSMLA